MADMHPEPQGQVAGRLVQEVSVIAPRPGETWVSEAEDLTAIRLAHAQLAAAIKAAASRPAGPPK